MFREMRRSKNALDHDTCIKLLKDTNRACIGFNGDDGYPYVIPINYYYDVDENIVYFHGAKVGHKIDALNKSNKVCLTIYDEGYLVEGDWARHVKSVVAFGKASLVEDINICESKLRALAYKYYPNKDEADVEIASGLKYVQMIAMHIEHISGKEIVEK